MPATIRVEYLFSRACPSHEEGLERLRDAARAARVELDVHVVEIRDDDEAARRRFPGSPTYLIEGRDLVEPTPGVAPRADACRAYAGPGGRVGPLPHRDTLASALAATSVDSGEPEMTLTPGAAAPHFELPTTEGATVSLSGLLGEADALIVAFWCNHCPYVQAWEERLIALVAERQPDGLAAIAINSNDVSTHPADSFEAMVERAAERGYPFHYAHDESQEVPKAFGATRTPEVFLLDGDGVVAYHGAIDDSHDPENATVHHLAEAVDAVLSGESPALSTTQPVGCTIKWKR